MDASQCIQCPDGVCPVHPVVAPSKSPGLLLTVATLVSLATTVGTEAAWAQDTACQVNTVPRTVLGEHIRAAARAHGDFNIVASTNWTRFYSALYLGLVRDAIERRPEGGVLYFSSQSLFREFLPVSGLTDPTKAPADLLWAVQLGAGTWLAYRPSGIIAEVRNGPRPRLAANVRIAWPDGEDGQDDYSFIDTLSTPQLKVTNRQIITFRQLDLGDMVVHDEVRGTSGRPLSGMLGALFNMIGEASIRYSRSAVASDGVQVMRVRVKKVFSVTPTVTVYPDGRAEKDVPQGRLDLAAIEERLSQDLEIEYHPYRCW